MNIYFYIFIYKKFIFLGKNKFKIDKKIQYKWQIKT